MPARRSAVQYCLFLLGLRARTREYLREKLQQKNYSEEEIRDALGELERLHLIDDAEFARQYAQEKVRIHRRGRHRIGLELQQKGVSKEMIAEALSAIDSQDELASAQSLLQARQRQWAKLTERQRFERSLALLQRRGFSPSVIRMALEK